ncbi:hypothetical protein J6590_023356 [Homalodisca vitripennis]|nr:hypothetical protein J6590_023356 [Homalodisca vitripennis]
MDANRKRRYLSLVLQPRKRVKVFGSGSFTSRRQGQGTREGFLESTIPSSGGQLFKNSSSDQLLVPLVLERGSVPKKKTSRRSPIRYFVLYRPGLTGKSFSIFVSSLQQNKSLDFKKDRHLLLIGSFNFGGKQTSRSIFFTSTPKNNQ